MALVVLHLHECKIVHRNIGLAFFKVFLIDEPPRSTNLRVKLVSMKAADVTSEDCEDTAKDIKDLGHAMMEVVLGDAAGSQDTMLLAIQNYDPSLYLLIV